MLQLGKSPADCDKTGHAFRGPVAMRFIQVTGMGGEHTTATEHAFSYFGKGWTHWAENWYVLTDSLVTRFTHVIGGIHLRVPIPSPQ